MIALYLYSIRFLKKNVQIRASEKPEQFLQIVSSLHDLFLCDSCLPGYQIWYQDDTVWIPIFGVSPEEQVIPVLFEDLIADISDATDNSRELGKIVIENYKKWFAEQEAIKRYNARRTGDPERLEVLQRKMNFVECSIDMVSQSDEDIDVKTLFAYMTNGTIAEATKKLNISRATYYRWQDHLYEVIGRWLLNNLDSAQLDELRIHTTKGGEYVGDSSTTIPKGSD